MRIKVGDDFLDSDNSLIAQTFAVNEIGRIETRQGGFSNNFTIPLTSKNQVILESPNNLNSSSRNPYKKVAATLFDNGSPVAFGSLKFQIVDETTLQASFFSDNTEWFNAIKDKTLQDLDLVDFDHAWTSANILDSSINTPSTSGYIYPLIDYGEFLTEATLSTTVTQMYPAMYVHTMITQIFFEAGWKISGELVDYPLYKSMILPFSNAELVQSESVIDDNYQLIDKPTNQLLSTLGDYFVWWQGTDSMVDLSVSGNYDFKYQITFTNIGGTQVTVGFYINGVLDTALGTVAADSTQVYQILDVSISAGDFVQLKCDDSPGDVAVATTDSFVEAILLSDMVEGSTIVMSSNVPVKMKQTDLVQYIFFIFGIVAQANTLSKTVTLNFFRSIKGNLNDAVDWSDKIDLSKSFQTDFTQLLNNYKAVSIFDYLDDDQDNELVAYEAETGRTFGEGQFDIANEHIAGIKTVYEAPFASLININSFTNKIYIPQIKWLDSSGVRAFNPLPRVAIIEVGLSVSLLTNAAATSFTYGGNASNTIPFAWFVKTDYTTETDLFDDSLAFDQVSFPNANGRPLIEGYLEDYEDILNSMKYYKGFFHLTDVDISNLDFTIPVFIDFLKSYFYISKISNFKGSKRTTEAELVKIGGSGLLGVQPWILATGDWDDTGIWIDSDVWID